MTISHELDTLEGHVEKLEFRNEICETQDDLFSPSPITTSRRPTFLRKFWTDTIDDLRVIRWRRLFGQIGLHLLTLVVVTILLWLTIIFAWPREFHLTYSPCTPDGSFHVGSPATYLYNPWQQDSIFTIDLGFGSMSFATAKGVDVVWDVGFGRGGQGLLALISYRVCTKSLSRLMEKKAVTRRTFEAVTLQSVSFEALYKAIRDFFRNGSARAMWTVFWIILSTSFLLSFQSISSAMTGYSARLGAYIQIDTGERVPATQFSPVQYVIHDGHRLGGDFRDDHYVVLPSQHSPTSASFVTSSFVYANASRYVSVPVISGECASFAPLHFDRLQRQSVFSWDDYETTGGTSDSIRSSCLLMWHVSEYVAQYGFLGQNNTNSTFNNSGSVLSVPAPSLNISAYFGDDYDAPVNSPWSAIPYGWDWQDPAGLFPFRDSSLLYAYNDQAYNLSTIASQGVCQQADVNHIRYQWGFSSALLVLFLALSLVWTLGTYAVYLDAYLNSELDLNARDINLKRAVFDLHAAMKKDLVGEPDLGALGDSKLRRLLKDGHLDYTHLLAGDRPATRAAAVGRWRRDFSLVRWLRAEKWWILVHLVCALFLVLSFVAPAFGVWYRWLVSWAPWLGSLVVLVCGRAHASRWIWFALSLLLTFSVDLTMGSLFPPYY